MKHISHRKPSQTTGMLHLANPLIPCNIVPVGQRYKRSLYTMDQVYLCVFISLDAASQFAYSWVSSLLQQQFNRNKNIFPSILFFLSSLVLCTCPPQQKKWNHRLWVFFIQLSIFHSFPTFICQKRPVVPRFLQSQGWTVEGVTFMRTCSWTNSGFSNLGVQPLCRVMGWWSYHFWAVMLGDSKLMAMNAFSS